MPYEVVPTSSGFGITMGIPIMSAVVTARAHALGGESAHAVLGGITTAIGVDAALCALTAILVGLFLRLHGRVTR